MDIIFGASILASFLAGAVALFAPCCITVLLPAYLASTFREKRNVLKMTMVFFAGIAVVLIPIGLGAAGLAQIFQNFHMELYIAGGLLMILFGFLSVMGKGLTILPMPKRIAPKGDMQHPKSVFLLGIFSGAATSCCAPVLAGAMTLAIVSGTFSKALIVTFAYVFGMTLPLFLAAYFYDRFHIQDSRFIRGKVLSFTIGAKEFFVHSTNLLAGAVFFLIGGMLLTLAFSGDVFWSPAYQVSVGKTLNQWSARLFEVLSAIPDIAWGIVVAAIFLFFLYKALRRSRADES